jgi:hypothetical protein
MKRLLMLMLLMPASGAQADIYTWTDTRGIAHYTNKEYAIPERYRARAKPLHLEAVEPGSASMPQQGTPSQPQGTPAAPQAAPSNPAPPPVVSAPAPQAPVSGKVSPRGKL